eukprot:scaffold859_cov306-Pinguiococcus_pyrenoidosus.AAC.2
MQQPHSVTVNLDAEIQDWSDMNLHRDTIGYVPILIVALSLNRHFVESTSIHPYNRQIIFADRMLPFTLRFLKGSLFYSQDSILSANQTPTALEERFGRAGLSSDFGPLFCSGGLGCGRRRLQVAAAHARVRFALATSGGLRTLLRARLQNTDDCCAARESGIS